MAQKLIFGSKKYKLGRTWWQRKHLLRTMTNQLITHERIKTTETKAKALSQFAEKVMGLARKAHLSSIQPNNQYQHRLRGIIHSPSALRKLRDELAPRLQGHYSNYTKVVRLDKRKGDNAQTAYVEIRGNALEQYEKALEKDQLASGEKQDVAKWKQGNLKQERDFFQDKLDQEREALQVLTLENNSVSALKAQQGVVRFFEEKLRRVEHDLFINDKNPYELRKYPKQF